MKDKKMIYSKFQTIELIAYGEYKEYEYAVINYGTHPCCYVKLEQDDQFFGHEYANIPIACHGGLTYSRKVLQLSSTEIDSDGWWIGWDYSHTGDYVPYLEAILDKEDVNRLKKWSTEELIGECKNVIDQLSE